MKWSGTIISSLLAIGLGWGALWGGTQALKIYSGTSPASETNKASAIESVKPVTETVTPSITILMGGDVMFDRTVRLLGENYGYDSLLAPLASLFKSADIVAVNLEGPITSSSSKTLLGNGKFTDNFNFTFPPQAAGALAQAGVTLVSLANNHADNFGMKGFNETKSYLNMAGVGYFGDPWNDAGTEKEVCKNDICVTFIGYHAFQSGFDRILGEVKSLSNAGKFVIVMPHWGEEYDPIPPPDIRKKARQLAEAGAKAIIGSHPHVIGAHEWLGTVPVIYSLGNLLFDQYFSPETMKGNLVELRLVKSGGDIKLDRVRIYETSTASKKDATVNPEPVDFGI